MAMLKFKNSAEDRQEVIHNIEVVLTEKIAHADYFVYALYHPQIPLNHLEPTKFRCIEKPEFGSITFPARFLETGVHAYYIVRHMGEKFKALKVVIELDKGLNFASGQVGEVEGGRTDFARYVAEDKWIISALRRQASND